MPPVPKLPAPTYTTGWRCASDLTVRLGRLAAETGIFPLYEVDNGKYKMSFRFPKLRPVNDYLKGQGRFRHLSDDAISLIQDRVSKEYSDLVEKAKK